MKSAHHIVVISDGTGGTAERACRAAMTQFKETPVTIRLRPAVRSEEQVIEAVKEAAELEGVIIHTMVSNKLRNVIAHEGRLHNVETIDLMGPLLVQLADHFSNSPSEKPGLLRELNKEYFKRIEAVEFALRHDDGLHTNELLEAEIVLLGVSRTFKTPLSIYLAFKGWLVGNVPVVFDFQLPGIIFELPPEKVFCLTASPYDLSELRRARHLYLGGSTGEYANFDFVRKELAYAKRIFDSRPEWTVIRVTNKPIEEIASQILAIIRGRQQTMEAS